MGTLQECCRIWKPLSDAFNLQIILTHMKCNASRHLYTSSPENWSRVFSVGKPLPFSPAWMSAPYSTLTSSFIHDTSLQYSFSTSAYGTDCKIKTVSILHRLNGHKIILRIKLWPALPSYKSTRCKEIYSSSTNWDTIFTFTRAIRYLRELNNHLYT